MSSPLSLPPSAIFSFPPTPAHPTQSSQSTYDHLTTFFPPNVRFRPDTVCHIYTDSLITLNNLKRPDQSFNPPLFHKILTLAHSLPLKFHFQWIPAHSGHLGNELADRLARSAAHSDLPAYNPPQFTTKSGTKMIIKKSLQHVLEQNWGLIVTQKPHLLQFFPSYQHLQKYLLQSHLFPQLNNLISNHLPTFSHLYKVGLSAGPSCPRCLCVDDIQHLFLACLRFSKQRRILATKIHSEASLTIEIIHQSFSDLNIPNLAAIHKFLIDTIAFPTQRCYKRLLLQTDISVKKLKK
jgi:hypothetical protein